MIRDFFRNLGVAEGENGVFQKKDAGRGQNVVAEVRGAEKRLVGKIGRQEQSARQFQTPAA